MQIVLLSFLLNIFAIFAVNFQCFDYIITSLATFSQYLIEFFCNFSTKFSIESNTAGNHRKCSPAVFLILPCLSAPYYPRRRS